MFPPLPSDPLVSIVMPAYNYARFLPEAIDSVLSQDHPRIELIVIDDGSTDDTPDVLASYGTRLWSVRQPNAGQTVALNRGWRQASGDVIGYLNADDVLAPGAIAAGVDALRMRPDAVMSYGDFTLIDAESRETARCRLPDLIDLTAILRFGHSPFGPGSFIRRLAGLPAWDETLFRVLDFDYALRLACLGPFVHVPRVVASFRVHEQSISFAKPPDRVTEESIRVVRQLYASAPLPPHIVAVKGRAFAMARMTAAQGHLRARRWHRAAWCIARALGCCPAVLGDAYAYRLVISGVAGQFLHRRRSRQLAHRAADTATADSPGAVAADFVSSQRSSSAGD
jgi:glycosyltransferase involved in cell wall biosynthesis